jgi:hypothetical protein
MCGLLLLVALAAVLLPLISLGGVLVALGWVEQHWQWFALALALALIAAWQRRRGRRDA